MSTTPRKWLGVAGLGLLTLAAFVLRVWHLDVPTITHPEAYAPGIPFPVFAENPIARHTFTDIVRSTLTSDNHPPGYYFLLLPWTRLFGASLFALRLPSVILGALTVPLLFATARRTNGRWVAVISATWLAFHGHHAFWSTQARMWVMCTALVVVSVLAAVKLRERFHPAWAVIYVVSVVAGLWVEYNFWPLFAAQVIWELAARRRADTMTPTLALQCVALILASPVLAFFFLRIDASEYLESSVLEHLFYTAAFAHWFEPTVFIDSELWQRALYVALALTGACVMLLGALYTRESPLGHIDHTPVSHWLEWAVWLSIVGPASFVWRWGDRLGGRRYEMLVLLVPLLVAFGYRIASLSWTMVRSAASRMFDVPIVRSVVADSAVMHSLVPLALLSIVHLKLPCLAPRGLLVLTPFFIVLAARGITYVVRGTSSRAIVTAAIAAAGIGSAWYGAPPPSRDYKSLAAAIDAARKPGDVLVIEDAWYAQPLHYYLRPDMMTSYDHEALLTPDEWRLFESRVERAWVVGFGADSRRRVSELTRPFGGYREVQFVSAFEAGAVLVERQH